MTTVACPGYHGLDGHAREEVYPGWSMVLRLVLRLILRLVLWLIYGIWRFDGFIRPSD